MMRVVVLLVLFLGGLAVPVEAAAKKIPEKAITVIIPSYNNAQVYRKNLETLFSQNYGNYRVIYIDDVSSDGTADLVEEYVHQSGHRDRFTLIRNTERSGAMKNFYDAIHSCDDENIIVNYDGDDWLAHDDVLSKVNEAYSGKRPVWLTHGSFVYYPDGGGGWNLPIPKKIVKANQFRKFRCPSHLRTYYAWLFKKIKVEDLMYEGEFYSMACDLAMMYPMIEMAGERHAFIEDVLYIYNTTNPLSDFRQDGSYQSRLSAHIRKQPPYQRLKSRHSQPQ